MERAIVTITFRPMTADDRQFVISTWSSSFRTSPYAGMIRNDRWSDVMHPETAALIDRATTRTIVACEPSELDHLGRQFLYGFIATGPSRMPLVHYCYVKNKFRRRGIARRLFDAAGIDPAGGFVYTYRTNIAKWILEVCRCGHPRKAHERHQTGVCEHFNAKIPGATWDPVPAREGL